jgi:hypothetical protein
MENIKVMHYSEWKADRNFQNMIISANYIFKVLIEPQCPFQND